MIVNDQYSENFLLWCKKTANLSDDDWKRGFSAIEYRLKEAGRQGDTLWPPSYAEFLGYCEKPHGEAAYKSFQKRLPVPPEFESKRKKAARKEIDSMMGMFE